eukprot:TCALIF_07377-PA protein Name:"Protein of unknown function" AED:0.28 eAED:0.32 QI:0/0/0/0.25/1/1/4/0/227
MNHNVRTIKKYYPGYRMRLYYRLTDNEMAMERLCQLACEEEILDLCDISRNPMVLNASSYYPLVWRFLPALDAQVDLMLSRDLDSDITAREQAAVSEFLQQENKTFHIMRDHKDHTIEILGGTWAVKLDHGLTRHLMVKGMKKMLQDPTVLNIGKDRGLDQFLLVRGEFRQEMSHGLGPKVKISTMPSLPENNGSAQGLVRRLRNDHVSKSSVGYGLPYQVDRNSFD